MTMKQLLPLDPFRKSYLPCAEFKVSWVWNKTYTLSLRYCKTKEMKEIEKDMLIINKYWISDKKIICAFTEYSIRKHGWQFWINIQKYVFWGPRGKLCCRLLSDAILRLFYSYPTFVLLV